MAEFDFDLITIGAGSGGVRASRFAADLGARVAIIEARELGGTCVNVGCIPKKLLSYAAHFAEDFEDARGFGWSSTNPTFDWPAFVAAKDREIERLNGIYERVLAEAGVLVLRGRARLLGPHEVRVGTRTVSAGRILVATGARPVRPVLPGSAAMITSEEAFHLKTLPRRAVIYGAGYIALEFASIFNGLGVDTHLVYRSSGLLRGFDADLREHLASEISAKGVHLHPTTRIERLETRGAQDTQGAHRVYLSEGTTLEVDCVLAATGRTPNTADLGLVEVGVTLGGRGEIQVDESYTSSVPSIHAIGDVTDRIQLTPVALAEGMAFAERWFGRGLRAVSYERVPTAVFCHPNVAAVGLTESAARAAGMAVRIFRSRFGPLKHTLSGRNEQSFMKLVVDRDTDRVLGVHLVGADAGEVIQGFAVALNCGATKAQFDRTIGVHPTLAEEFLTLRTPIG
jgi:glutathione reductase (NADPH)